MKISKTKKTDDTVVQTSDSTVELKPTNKKVHSVSQAEPIEHDENEVGLPGYTEEKNIDIDALENDVWWNDREIAKSADNLVYHIRTRGLEYTKKDISDKELKDIASKVIGRQM